MTLTDNPIGASYVYLLEPEIRFPEASQQKQRERQIHRALSASY
jgi:hypothetical protein